MIDFLTLDVRDYYSEDEIKKLHEECPICGINGVGFCQMHSPHYGVNNNYLRDLLCHPEIIGNRIRESFSKSPEELLKEQLEKEFNHVSITTTIIIDGECENITDKRTLLELEKG